MAQKGIEVGKVVQFEKDVLGEKGGSSGNCVAWTTVRKTKIRDNNRCIQSRATATTTTTTTAGALYLPRMKVMAVVN